MKRLTTDPLWTLAILGAVALVGLAYWISYGALRDLAGDARWPLCLDLPGLIAGFLAISHARRSQRDRYTELIAVMFGLAVVAGNVAEAWPDPRQYGAIDVVIRGAPAVTLLAVFHLVLREWIAPGRRLARREPRTEPAVEAKRLTVVPDPVRDPVPEGDRLRRVRAWLQAGERLSNATVAKRLGVSRATGGRLLARARQTA